MSLLTAPFFSELDINLPLLGGSNLVSAGCGPSSPRLRLLSLPSSLLSGVFLRFPARHCLRFYESVRPSGELPLMQHCSSAFKCVCLCMCLSPALYLPISVASHSHCFCVVPCILLSQPSAEWRSCNFSISADGRIDALSLLRVINLTFFLILNLTQDESTSS